MITQAMDQIQADRAGKGGHDAGIRACPFFCRVRSIAYLLLHRINRVVAQGVGVVKDAGESGDGGS